MLTTMAQLPVAAPARTARHTERSLLAFAGSRTSDRTPRRRSALPLTAGRIGGHSLRVGARPPLVVRGRSRPHDRP